MAVSRVTTVGSLLTTVSTAANAITSTLNTATKSVGMLDAFVTKAADEQALQYRRDKEIFLQSLIRDSAEEAAEADIRVEAYIAKSPAHKAHYERQFERFEQLFEDQLNLKPSE